MAISIQLPTVLRDYTEGRAELEAEAGDVAAALNAVAGTYPLLRRHLFGEGGELRAYVNVYVNENEVRDLPGGIETPLVPGDVVMILPSIAGG